MGRASRQEAGRNRERVVETAARLFREHGVENVSIADIMSAADLTSGGFYRQFDSKEALTEEAFAAAFANSAESWRRVRAGGGAPQASGLRALVRHYFRRRPAEKNCPMLALSSATSHLPSGSPAADAYGEGAEALFAQFREEVLGSPGAPSESDALVLFAAMIGTGLLTQAVGRNPWIGSMQKAVLDALPDGESR